MGAGPRWLLLICAILLLETTPLSRAYFKEKKLAKLLLLGAALAPRGFIPIPIPEYGHDGDHHKVVHVHHNHHHGHHHGHHHHMGHIGHYGLHMGHHYGGYGM